MKNPCILFLSLFYCFSSYGQDADKATSQLMQTADSVVLISHIVTKEHALKDEGLANGQNVPKEHPPFLINNQINPFIIKERAKLAKAEVHELGRLFRLPVKKSNIGYLSLCFAPRNSILIYKEGRLSYIDLCFTCRGIATSEDLELNEHYFNESKWVKLRNYFQTKGIRFGLYEKK